MARKRTLRIKPNGIFDTLLSTEYRVFDQFQEIFALISNALKTEDNHYLLTESGEHIQLEAA